MFSRFIRGNSLLLMLLVGCFVFSYRPNTQRDFGYAKMEQSFNYMLIDGNSLEDVWLKTIGDINGDGLLDLIAGGNAAGGLIWFENPNWVKHIIASQRALSTDAETYDVDQDGDNDVIALTTSEILWFENPIWTLHSIDSRILHDLEIADFDNDGDIDIVARDQGEFGHKGDELHFYQHETPSSWTHKIVKIADGEGLKVADIDDDDDQDVVVNGSWYENTGNIINGPWSEYSYTTNWDHPNAFVNTGDIDGDGRVDIVLSPSELAGQYYRISWFKAPVDPKSGNWTEHIVADNIEAVHHFVGVADMDSDGDMDIATAEMVQGKNPDEIKIYINDAGNGQSWMKLVIATTGSHSMRLLDFDNDGDMDLYGANWQGQDVELWENTICSTSLDSWERHIVDDSRPWRAVFITSADIDGDNLDDIITGGWWYQNPGDPGGQWARNTIGSPLNNMAAVYDFDGDNHVDILGTQGKGSDPDPRFVWAHNSGTGSFNILNNVESRKGDFLQGVAVGQLRDGDNYTVALSWHMADQGVQTLTIPSVSVIEPWTWSKISATSQDEALDFGDIDRDGDLDLLLGTIWLENQGTSWSESVLHDISAAPYGESDPDRNHLADINSDGRLDAVVGYEAISVPGKLAWYEQGLDSNSTWTEHLIASVVGPMSLDVADMDTDGDFDIIVGEHNLDDPTNASLYVFENADGKGDQWVEHLVYTGDEHHDGGQVFDIEGDGDLDIVSIGWGHANVILYENKSSNCDEVPPPSPTPTPGSFKNIYIPIIFRYR